jgi:hypothetical protein
MSADSIRKKIVETWWKVHAIIRSRLKVEHGVGVFVVTEAEWLLSNDPEAMLDHLGRRVSRRKLRLFGCACYRHVPRLVMDETVRTAVEVSERYADKLASKQELAHALSLAFSSMWASGGPMAYPTPRGVRSARRLTARAAGDGESERRYQAAVLRDLFGNPFRRFAAPHSARAAGVVGLLAESIYADRAFDRLPILADALEEAGFTEPDVLNHCRDGAEHARGCWVLDMVLVR